MVNKSRNEAKHVHENAVVELRRKGLDYANNKQTTSQNGWQKKSKDKRTTMTEKQTNKKNIWVLAMMRRGNEIE